MSNSNGGPAFPGQDNARCSGTSLDPEYFTGMTLRDYFAASVAPVFANFVDFHKFDGTSVHFTPESVANRAYAVADAMIAERTRRENAT